MHAFEDGSGLALLFLCSGNFYRSRFAELLFNDLAFRSGEPHRALSRGLALDHRNSGPISPFAVSALRERGVTLPPVLRAPLAVTTRDLEAADLIVAVSDREHRPMLAARFPGFVERTRYLDVPDVGEMAPEEALPRLDGAVRRLLAGLRQGEGVAGAA